MKPVTIFGIGQYGEVARYQFGPRAAAFTVEPRYMQTGHLGLPVFNWENLHPSGELFIAVGNNLERARLYDKAKARGWKLASLVSDRSNLSQCDYGEHACILEFNNVQPCVEIGANCVLWSGNHIGHHSRIGNHCMITSHVVISGGVEIGDYCFFGVNSTVFDHVKIGNNCTIAAGAVVDRDIPDNHTLSRKGVLVSNEVAKTR